MDGQPVPAPPLRVYLLLNKPFGYLCALKDPAGRPLVIDLLGDCPYRVYPVGRLDFDSMGLLLLTNDGDWAHRVMHPRSQIPRTYKATIAGAITDHALDRLRGGVDLEDGPTGPAKATLIHRGQGRSLVRMTIKQGKNRQIRRMMEAVGFEVVHLIRTSFGSLSLGDLKPGEYRYLDAEEVKTLAKWGKSPGNRPGARKKSPPGKERNTAPDRLA